MNKHEQNKVESVQPFIIAVIIYALSILFVQCAGGPVFPPALRSPRTKTIFSSIPDAPCPVLV